jgi:putative zinc finger protein
MDCEKFESLLMDELYGELDELTSAALKRHVTGCARCSALIGGFRATRRVAALPKVEPPAGLEERIFAAAAAADPVVPVGWRVARAVSLAGSWAMRPQTAMAAVFLVMIGTSVLLLRGKSSRAPASAEMTVTEEGTPAPAAPSVAPPPPEPVSAQPLHSAVAVARSMEKAAPANAPAPVAIWAQPPGADVPGEDLRQRAGAKPGAAKAADGLGSIAQNAAPAHPAPAAAAAGAGGGPPRKTGAASMAEPEAAPFATPPSADASAELSAARAARDAAASQGLTCSSGSQFDDAARRAGATPLGWSALFEGALCYESAGDWSSARARLNALLGVDAFRARAQAELDRLDQAQRARGAGAGATRRAAPKSTAPQASPPPGSDSF